jgi:hypothetical protein
MCEAKNPCARRQGACAQGARAGLRGLAPDKCSGEKLVASRFGALLVYALARQLRLPLLLNGDDVAAIDLPPVPVASG